MKKLIPVVVLFLLLLIIVLKVDIGPDEKSEWVELTTRRITTSIQNDGGYLDFGVKFPSVYDTYYNLLTLQLFSARADYDPTLWLSTLYHNGRFEYQINAPLFNTFYAVKVFSLLNKEVPHRTEIIDYIMSLKDAEGYFLEDKNDTTFPLPLVNTIYALRILQVLKADVDLTETQAWLWRLWQELRQRELVRASEINIAMVVLLALAETGMDREKVLRDDRQLITRWLDLTFAETEWETDTFLADAADALEVIECYQLRYELPGGLVESITSGQNFDGGFNSFQSGPSDSFGTYCALRIVKAIKPRFTAPETVRAIKNLQLKSGGFVWWGSTGESNPLTTAAAISVLANIAPDAIPTKQVRPYVQQTWARFVNAEEIPWKSVAAFLKIASRLELDLQTWKYELLNLGNRELEHLQLEVGERLRELEQSSSVDQKMKQDIKSQVLLMEYPVLEVFYLLGAEPTVTPLTAQILPSLMNADGSYGSMEADILVTSMALIVKKFMGDSSNIDLSLRWLANQPLTDGSFALTTAGVNSDRIFSTTMSLLALEAWGQAGGELKCQADGWLKGRFDPDGGIKNQYTYIPEDGGEQGKVLQETTNLIWTAFGVQLQKLLQGGGDGDVLKWFVFAL